MFKKEWHNLLKNKMLLVVIVAIIAIPTIYSTLFLGSMWDPYGKVSNLPVAVVNEDQEVTFEGETLNVGETLVDSLKDNDSLDFHFVDSDSAQSGLEDGTYYMVITIPSNFSANAATVLDDETQTMELNYETNPGTNYIASKMSETAVAKIKTSVSEEVTKSYAKAIFTALKSAGDGMEEAASGAGQLSDGIQQLSDGIDAYTDGVASIADGTNELVANNATLNDGVTTLANGITSLQSGSDTLLAGLQTMSSTIGSTLPSADTITALEQGIDSYQSGITALNSALSSVDLGNTSDDLENSLVSIGSNTQAAANSLSQIGSAAAVLSTANLTAEQTQALYQIIAATQSAGQNLSTIGTQTQSVGTSLSSLSALTGKVTELKSAVSQLSDNSSLVLGGSKQAISGLYSGLSQVKTSLDSSVIPGTTQLTSGIAQLNSGVTAQNGLADGIAAYTDGVAALNSGAIELTENTDSLTSGMDELASGTDELQSQLSDGADTLQEIDATDDTYTMFASPVEAVETMVTTIANNGHAMAPYMMSVALWVGCLALSLMYPLTSYEGELKSGIAWWASKASVIYGIGIAQALVMVFCLHNINGFTPSNMGDTIFIACLSSLAFMSMLYFFNVLLGKVGSFLMLIFMVVQLAGSAGTYPIQLSGDFVAKIHKYLPFSYTVDSFRKTIAGTGISITDVHVLVGVLVIFTLLTIGVFQARAIKIKQGKPNSADFLEEHGLA